MSFFIIKVELRRYLETLLKSGAKKQFKPAAQTADEMQRVQVDSNRAAPTLESEQPDAGDLVLTAQSPRPARKRLTFDEAFSAGAFDKCLKLALKRAADYDEEHHHTSSAGKFLAYTPLLRTYQAIGDMTNAFETFESLYTNRKLFGAHDFKAVQESFFAFLQQGRLDARTYIETFSTLADYDEEKLLADFDAFNEATSPVSAQPQPLAEPA